MTIACVLAASAAGGAFGANGSASPSVQLAVSGLSGGGSVARNHTCQAGDYRKTTTHTVMIGNMRKTVAVVACEQPPRSEIIVPQGLKNAVTGALAEDG